MKRLFLLVNILILSLLIRFYQLGQNPPSLYWDEASLGYNAYAIATAGIDEHGEKFPLARFTAFGDYKPPGYIYADAFIIKLFGLSEQTIRFPSVLAGIGIVLISYFLSLLLFESNTIGLFTAFCVALSPWSIQLSRAAFEANLAAFFNCFAVYLFIYAVKRNRLAMIGSMIMFVFSFYTFNANRIIAPILFISLSLLFFKTIWNSKRLYGLALIIGFIMILPSISFLRSSESRLRFNEVSIFTDLSVIEKSNARISRENNAIWARLLQNRRILYAQLFTQHFADHFNLRYLFFKGDRNPRLSVQVVGELYLYELVFLLIGIYYLFIRKREVLIIFIIWVIASIIPGAAARETPHALRTVSLIPVYQMIVGLGLFSAWKIITRRYNRQMITQCFTLIILIVGISSWFYYLHYYFIHYPIDWANEWQDGYKEMVKEVSMIENNYDSIVITEQRGRPYIYFLLYQHINPQIYTLKRESQRDVWGVWKIKKFAKYYFDLSVRDQLPGKVLLVLGPNELNQQNKVIKSIYSVNGDKIFTLAER